ncbi:hypothetical protein Q9R32_15150 [Actinotalea sp. AC32]|nr:hypothetical protein [Actinotalea sp. AC32]
MNISSVVGALVRRWYVTLVLLAATGYLAAQLWESAEPVYSSTTVVSVVQSPAYMETQQSEDPLVLSRNPYGQSTTTLSALLADSIAHGNVELTGDAEGAVLTVQVNNQRAESFFTVSATARDAESALAALRVLQEQAPVVLADIQQRAGAPADQLITSILSRPATTPVEEYPDRMRVVLGVVLVGLLVTALLATAVDGAVRGGRRRRAATRAARAERTSAARTPSTDAGTRGTADPAPEGSTTSTVGTGHQDAGSTRA